MSASACDSGCLDLRLVRFRIELNLWLLSALSFFPLLPCGTLGFSSLEPNFFHHLGHDLFGGFRMLFEKLLRRFAALADSLTAERIPSTDLLDDAHFTSKVDGFTVRVYTVSLKGIEVRLLSGQIY